MKITFIFNNNDWTTVDQKVKNICHFFDPALTIVPTILKTSFTNIEWQKVNTLDGTGHQDGTDVVGQAETISNAWYDKNIIPLAIGAEVIVFFIGAGDKVNHPFAPSGIRGDNDEGPVECVVFGQNEFDRVYVNGNDIGNAFEIFAAHEISHALYFIAGKKDNTHLYFYSGQPAKVLSDLKGTSYNATLFLTRLINFLKVLLGNLVAQQKNITTIVTTPPVPMGNGFTKYPMVYKWAKAIEVAEGTAKYLNNPGSLKVAGLTAEWGAKNGIQATDGGWIAKFDTYNQGFQALCNFLELGCRDQLIAFHKTAEHPEARMLTGFTKIYAGNPPQGYIDEIVHLLAVDKNVSVSAFLN